MKRTIAVLVLVTLAALLCADMQVNTFDKTAVETIPGKLPTTTRDTLVYSFSTEGFPMQTNYFDYMPGSYNSCPIRVQNGLTPGTNGIYMLYHGMETANATRREYYTFWNPNTNAASVGYVGNTDCREGYGGIDLDFITQDPLFSWHIDPEGDGVYNDIFNFDLYHVLSGPGLIGTPFQVILNDDWTGMGFTPPFDDDEFIWPYTFISKAPSYNEDGKRRAYIIANNSVAHSNLDNPSENVLIAYADYATSDLENGNMQNLDWEFVTIPMMNAWNASGDWIRPFHCPIVSEDGRFAIMGYLVGDEDEAVITSTYPETFVLWNDNYAEGDWNYLSTNMEQYVDNPLDLNGEPTFSADSLHFHFTHSGHFAAAFDTDKRIHVPSCFGLNGISDDTGEGVYFPYYLFMRDYVIDLDTEEQVINNLYPMGEGPIDEPYLPWDEDHDGQIDEYDPDGNVMSTNGWPIWWYVADDAFHENTFKIASDPTTNTLAAVWSDGLKSRWYNDGGDEDYAQWATVPEIYISLWDWHDETWCKPMQLNSIYTPELDGVIPAYVYPGDRLEYLGDDTFRLHLMYFDDNSYGSFAQNNNGSNDGGTMTYAALDITVPWEVTSEVDPNEVPGISGMLRQNYPNPFNPTTQIEFNLPADADVELTVYNVRGQKVKTLVNGETEAGEHVVTWEGRNDNGSTVSSGVYFYQLKTGDVTETRKMLMMK